MKYVFCVLALLIFGTGCGPKGPIITDCISNPKANNFICYNEKQQKKVSFAPSAVDNWIFVSAADEQSFLNACAKKQGGVKISVCVFAAATLNFACFNEVTGQSFGMTFQQSENWIGVSPVDEQLILEFCQSLASS